MSNFFNALKKYRSMLYEISIKLEQAIFIIHLYIYESKEDVLVKFKCDDYNYFNDYF